MASLKNNFCLPCILYYFHFPSFFSSQTFMCITSLRLQAMFICLIQLLCITYKDCVLHLKINMHLFVFKLLLFSFLIVWLVLIKKHSFNVPMPFWIGQKAHPLSICWKGHWKDIMWLQMLTMSNTLCTALNNLCFR